MASYQGHPIIMPLSNPTSKAEALPDDLLEWTDGKALIATGSPFGAMDYHGTHYVIAQANNALVFPGIGLGVITTQARRISHGMILAAAKAVAIAGFSTSTGASLLPAINELRSVSAQVGLAVARQAIAEGLAEIVPEDDVQAVSEQMWRPGYPAVEAVDVI